MHMGIPVCKQAGIAKTIAYGDPITHNEVVRIRGLTYMPTCYTGAYFWVKICTRVACRHVHMSTGGHFLMYTCVHAQQKHVLCGQVDKRETHPKKNFSQRHTWMKNQKKVEVRTCVHVHMLKEITA
jgi:hypothetical protein